MLAVKGRVRLSVLPRFCPGFLLEGRDPFARPVFFLCYSHMSKPVEHRRHTKAGLSPAQKGEPSPISDKPHE
jgi:hypothetical protein